MDVKKILDEHLLWLNGEGGSRANLCDANLFGADLCDADLRGADLCDADLRGADLCDADLRGANLFGADLRGANLCDANLSNANLSCASMDQMIWDIHTAFYPLQCPDSGSYIGYKKASGLVVELEIPADARRSSATSRECRASKAKVLSITDINGNPGGDQVRSNFDPNFVYAIGETVEVSDFDDDRWNECSTGIHHFITRAEAVIYE